MSTNEIKAISKMLAYISEHYNNNKFMTIIKCNNDEYKCFAYNINDNIDSNLIAKFENLNIYDLNDEITISISDKQSSHSKSYLNTLLKYLSDEEAEILESYKGDCLSRDDYIYYDIDELCIAYIKNNFKQSYMKYLSDSFYSILKNKCKDGN